MLKRDTVETSVRNGATLETENNMAWSISIAVDAWQEIRDELATWSKRRLIDAIVDDKFEAVFQKAGHQHAELAASAESQLQERTAEGNRHRLATDASFPRS